VIGGHRSPPSSEAGGGRRLIVSALESEDPKVRRSGVIAFHEPATAARYGAKPESIDLKTSGLLAVRSGMIGTMVT